jgi:hypothetical protein
MSDIMKKLFLNFMVLLAINIYAQETNMKIENENWYDYSNDLKNGSTNYYFSNNGTFIYRKIYSHKAIVDGINIHETIIYGKYIQNNNILTLEFQRAKPIGLGNIFIQTFEIIELTDDVVIFCIDGIKKIKMNRENGNPQKLIEEVMEK